jgi:hypothetical protein
MRNVKVATIVPNKVFHPLQSDSSDSEIEVKKTNEKELSIKQLQKESDFVRK